MDSKSLGGGWFKRLYREAKVSALPNRRPSSYNVPCFLCEERMKNSRGNKQRGKGLALSMLSTKAFRSAQPGRVSGAE
jgi:hypothetical protein